MTCRCVTPYLDALLDRELSPDLNRALAEHAAQCRDCSRLLTHARAVHAALRTLPVPEPRPEFLSAALQRAKQTAAAQRRRRSSWRAPFGGAMAASLVAIFVAGGWLRDETTSNEDPTVVSMTLNELRTVNLVFAAATELDDVSLTVELPDGVEVQGYAGRRELGWSTHLKTGNNLLALPLITVGGVGGSLVAHLRHNGEHKTFVVTIDIS